MRVMLCAKGSELRRQTVKGEPRSQMEHIMYIAAVGHRIAAHSGSTIEIASKTNVYSRSVQPHKSRRSKLWCRTRERGSHLSNATIGGPLAHLQSLVTPGEAFDNHRHNGTILTELFATRSSSKLPNGMFPRSLDTRAIRQLQR